METLHQAMTTIVYPFRQNAVAEASWIRSCVATTESRWLPQPAATVPGEWFTKKGYLNGYMG